MQKKIQIHLLLINIIYSITVFNLLRYIFVIMDTKETRKRSFVKNRFYAGHINIKY